MNKQAIYLIISIALTATLTFCLQNAMAQPPQPSTVVQEENRLPVPKNKTSSAKEKALKDFLSTENDYLQRFATKHGELLIGDEYGNFGKDTHIMLNGVVIFKAQKTPDGRQQEVFVHPSKLTFQRSEDHIPGKGPVKIDRILLSEGCGLNYVTQFILLDFTCDKPFVSERFGFNPDLEGYVYLEKVKWGKEKSYIYMHVNQRAVYYTCDRVEMDWDYYMRKEEEDKKNKKNPRQIKPDKTPFRRP